VFWKAFNNSWSSFYKKLINDGIIVFSISIEELNSESSPLGTLFKEALLKGSFKIFNRSFT
jgi:hypothetical protein